MTNFKILMVDDDRHDIFLTQRAFDQLDWQGQFESVAGGDELYAYLGFTKDDSAQQTAVSGTLPDVLLLDLNMPRINGFEILNRIRKSERFAHLPVIILSTSESPEDIQKAYRLGANSFITKPSSPDAMTRLAKTFKNYWFELTLLPDDPSLAY